MQAWRDRLLSGGISAAIGRIREAVLLATLNRVPRRQPGAGLGQPSVGASGLHERDLVMDDDYDAMAAAREVAWWIADIAVWISISFTVMAHRVC